MLELECHEIDLQLAKALAENRIQNIDVEGYQKYIDNCRKILDLESSIIHLNEQIDLVNDVIITKIMQEPEKTVEIHNIYNPRLEHLQSRIVAKTQELDILEKENLLSKNDGICVRKLDDVLKELNVERQAFHGKSFIGNHVHKMLKHKNILTLCNSIPRLVTDKGLVGTEVHSLSVCIATKYKILFNNYAKCHFLFNSCKPFDTRNLNDLQTYISVFMLHFRSTWPDVPVPPKLHMLEDHVVPFIKEWGAGIGIYGEQGGESIHNEFNKLMRTYCTMKPNTRRLLSVLKEHHRRTNPTAKALKPEIKKRKRKLSK